VTLSRDIRDLRWSKRAKATRKWRPRKPARSFRCWRENSCKTSCARRIGGAQDLARTRQLGGRGSGQRKVPEVVGTIAGDDTIMVITPDNPTAESVQEKLLELLDRG